MKLWIQDNGNFQQADLLRRTVAERIPVETGENGMRIELRVDGELGAEESYCIERIPEGWIITGADKLGLFFGIGKFLHTARWSEKAFTPEPPTGVVTPALPLRVIYFAVHFHNWYHEASAEELKKYLEELLLWGYNTVKIIVPVVSLDNFDEPAFSEVMERERALCRLAKEFGMKIFQGLSANQGPASTPEAIGADLSIFEYRGGSSGKNICPHKKGAMKYLRNLWKLELSQFKDIGVDIVSTWPYDEGGCGCEQCRPWGANGYCYASKEMYRVVKEMYPDAKFVLPTWYFDFPINEGEYEGLWKRLKDDMAFVDYLLVDGHDEFPRYPLTHEKIKPILDFPEISMWGLMPWGGRGANPLPKRFQRIWDETKDFIAGGVPYSEGLFEDISKIQFVSYYWEPHRHYRDSLAEYINYEYSGDVIEKVLELMELIEENHVRVKEDRQPDLTVAERAEKIARDVDRNLPERARHAWRWRLLFIRAVMDKAVYQYHKDHDDGRAVPGMPTEMRVNRHGTRMTIQGDEVTLSMLRKTKEWYLSESEEAMQMAEELFKLYHTNREQGHMATFPPIQGREEILKGREFGTI